MNSVEENLVRVMLQCMITNDHDDVSGIPGQTLEQLAGITPIEIERVAGISRNALRIDWDEMNRNIRQIRSDSLMAELARVGASPGLIRDLFGLSGTRLTRLRVDCGAARPSRRRLNESEESRVVRRHRRNPIPADRGLARAEWCLEAARDLQLPYMPVHECSLKILP